MEPLEDADAPGYTAFIHQLRARMGKAN